VPWLRALDQGAAAGSAARLVLLAWLMGVALTAAMFWWFGLAMGRYAGVHGAFGLALLLVLAPVFQPQVWVFALVRHAARRRFGAVTGALAGSAAWVAAEWLWPKLLGDTLGHGLYPSAVLRQAADLGGAAGLTLVLLWANEAVVLAWARRADGVRAVARPLALAVALPLGLGLYGLAGVAEPEGVSAGPGGPATSSAPATQTLRVGLVQSNIVDYERLRREKGAAAVVREVLDVHYAMSYDAVERQKAQALLWSETVYPTTFGRPKSEAGAELDREIVGIVNAAGVPLVFGTYDRDDAVAAGGGEFNAAAFVAPRTGLVGTYRKTRLFPFTEALPAWLDGPRLAPLVRGMLPWAGAWRAGDGARVLPLRLADGREVPVLPLICLDDVDVGLAIDGARLGATAILTMSNDSWFTEHALGAQLHLAVAAFRSIETRLPQFRVTSNGYSAVIDARGEVRAGSRMGERTLVVGEVALREPPRTLMVAWGDWVGRAGAMGLLALALLAGARAWKSRLRGRLPDARAGAVATGSAVASSPLDTALPLPAEVVALTPAARFTAAALRLLAFGSLAWLATSVLAGEGALASNTLAQLRAFVALVLAPEAAARGLLWASRATLSLQGGHLVLAHGARRLELPLAEVGALRAWRIPGPCPGVSICTREGVAWGAGLARIDPVALHALLARECAKASAHAGSPTTSDPPRAGESSAKPPLSPAWAAWHACAFLAPRGGGALQHTLAKFVALPFLLAIPAYRLHQHIAFGGGLGEWQLFGLAAFAKGFGLWWAAWALGVVTVAAALRVAIEAATVAVAGSRPAQVLEVRRGLEWLGLALLYLGLPAWLVMRFLGG